MGKKKLLLMVVLLFVSNLSLISSEEFGYNLLEPEKIINITNIYINNTNHSNSTDYWTTDIGAAETVNGTEFGVNDGVLTLDISWLTSFINNGWCKLTGCTMEGNINMGGNNINNGGIITADLFVGDGSGLTNITGATGDNDFHIFINGSSFNNVNHNITAGDAETVEFAIIPGKKFIFGDTFT